ncbi:PDZ domain-containing protein [Sulfoacidibacillus thermotolerans]|uniref:PDZ domain-containing protein n=1 Tax=Sulfoacidibacillus thermotolerans TaxID=1765684 RepID=A0A2U3D8P0_SULT2|nr:PDZ domain-containing protein [Sulfoacidibacillus thermotolerans]PWI57642.1 hypothetical protein BM613_07570 [Sulfoacidibacillus thermotolerans]
MVVALWQQLSDGYMRLLMEPWIYFLLLAVVWLQYRRAERMERASFGVKVNFASLEWAISAVYGLLAGIVASSLFALLHIQVSAGEILAVWVLIFVLMWVDVRLTCTAYVGPLLILGSFILQWFVMRAGSQSIPWIRSLLNTPEHFSSLLLMTGILHVFEGVLVFLAGWRGASPLFVESRRGQIIGAFALQKFWPLPLVVGVGMGVAIPFPVLIGFSTFTIGYIPKTAARVAALPLILYGLLVTMGAFFARGHSVWILWVALFTLVAHEAIYQMIRRKEMHASALFVRPARGVRVLATLLRSPARMMGLQPGDTMIRVGGMSVNSAYDIHFALDQNPAYAKIEVVDLRGETRFLGTPVFENDPHQLGVIMVPDEHAREYAEIYPFSVGRWLFEWWRRKRSIGQKKSATMSERPNQGNSAPGS